MSEPKVTRPFAEIFADNLFRFATQLSREEANRQQSADQAELEMLDAAANEAATKRLEEWLSRTVESIIAQNGGVQ
ncbi:MAG TPA: hypothetical protein VKR60_06290 [Candidatus Sulfotelmatobacter sp.]|nr:hypothetical protein [Candidatus Sulfotelmatobacter sp.]